MTNEQLVIQIKAGINMAENMILLYNQTERFIYLIATKYKAYADMEDLTQEGYLSLYDAIDGYKADKGYKFTTYASHWISQRMRRYIHNNGSCIRLPVYTHNELSKYRKAKEFFQNEYGREATEGEIAYFMGVGVEFVQKLKKDAKMVDLVSLDKPALGMEEDNITVADSVADDTNIEESVIDALAAEQLKQELWKQVDTLEGRQPEVIRRRYLDNMTLEAIGKEYGVSRDTVRQMESKALRELRRPRRSKKIKLYLDDTMASLAYRSCGVAQFQRTWTSATEYAALKILERCM